MNTPLADIPVNPYTASELVRLALRKNDIDGPDESLSDVSSEDGAEEELEVVRKLFFLLGFRSMQNWFVSPSVLHFNRYNKNSLLIKIHPYISILYFYEFHIH